MYDNLHGELWMLFMFYVGLIFFLLLFLPEQSIVITIGVAVFTVCVVLFFGIWKYKSKGQYKWWIVIEHYKVCVCVCVLADVVCREYTILFKYIIFEVFNILCKHFFKSCEAWCAPLSVRKGAIKTTTVNVTTFTSVNNVQYLIYIKYIIPANKIHLLLSVIE